MLNKTVSSVPRLVILPERIVKRLRHPQPAEHEEEADRHEDRVVKINLQQPAVLICIPSYRTEKES